jgi:hypothetical protein
VSQMRQAVPEIVHCIPIPIVPFNAVLRFRLQADVNQAIARIVDHFRKRKAQFMWILHPSAKSHGLPERLLAHGLKDVEPIPGMARTLDDLPEIPPVLEGIEVRKVQGRRDSSAFYQFAAWRWHVPEQYQAHYESIARGFRFGEPGSKAHMWQAWREDQPVAKAGR